MRPPRNNLEDLGRRMRDQRISTEDFNMTITPGPHNLQEYQEALLDRSMVSSLVSSLYFSMVQYGIPQSCGLLGNPNFPLRVPDNANVVSVLIGKHHAVMGSHSTLTQTIKSSSREGSTCVTYHLQQSLSEPALAAFTYPPTSNMFRITTRGVKVSMPVHQPIPPGLLVMGGRAWEFTSKDIHNGFIPARKELTSADFSWMFTHGKKECEVPSRRPAYNEADVTLPSGKTIKVRSPRTGVTNLTFK